MSQSSEVEQESLLPFPHFFPLNPLPLVLLFIPSPPTHRNTHGEREKGGEERSLSTLRNESCSNRA